MPERTGHLAFGDVAAVWSLLTDLDVAGVIDEVVGARRSDAGASVGTYLALAALGRLVAPRSKKAFADWWASTAADRFTRISPKVLDHRKFWDAMHAVDADALQDISTRLAARMIEMFDLDTSSVALDMTNFATYIDTTNGKAPIAQRGKAKQKRTDLRLVGLGMVVTRAGGIPLVWHAYPGNRPDVTQFPTLIDHLAQRYTHPAPTTAADGRSRRRHRRPDPAVDDRGVRRRAELHRQLRPPARVRAALRRVRPAQRLPRPARPARAPTGNPSTRPATPALTAIDTRRDVYGQHRRVVLTHSQNLHDDQARSFTDTTLAKVGRKLDDLAATLARGKTRRTREQLTTEIEKITHDPWVHAVIDWEPHRRHPRRPPADLDHQPHQTRSVGNQRVRQTDPDHRPRRLARRRRRRRLPLPIRDRIRLPATQRPPRGVVLPDVPLDRPQHRRAHLHLRAGPATGPPAAPQGPPRRPRPVRQSPPGHPRPASRKPC